MKKILTTILVLLLMFSFGCAPKEEGKGTSGKAFAFTGKNGLLAEFDPDAPPSTNFVNEPVEMIIKLTNRGAVALSPGEVRAKLKGVAATDIFNPSTTEAGNEEEMLIAELDPTISEIDLGTITYSPEKMFSAEYKPEIEAEICFPYATKINANNFWISDEQTDLDKGKISESDNSDAPVHVTSLEEFKGTNKVRFQFTVENVGGGKIVDACFPEEKSDETVKINILEPAGITCETLEGSSTGEAKLINGKKIVRCSIEAPKGESYQTPLVMELEYNYDLELSKTVTIKNLE